MAKRRYVQVNELKPEMVDAYREAHETMHTGPWKEQLDVLRKAGAEDCIVYLYKNYSILLYDCDDIQESYSALGRDPRRKAWDEFTAPMFMNFPKFDGTGVTECAQKIFDLREQMQEDCRTLQEDI